MDMIQDWMIINKIKMGDPDAWDILVHKYYDTNGRHLLIGRILENNADEKGEPQYEEK